MSKVKCHKSNVNYLIMKIFFASSSNFGEVALQKMVESGMKPDALITAPDKKQGRGQKIKPLSIKKKVEEIGIEVREADNSIEFHRIIESEKPDVVTVAGFKVIIKKETLDIAEFVNIHPSLLPRYRGATPIQTAILDGVKESGVTIIKMNERIDQGPVIIQEKFIFDNNIKYKEAEEKLAEIGAVLVVKTLSLFMEGKIIPLEQDEEQATYTTLLEKKDGKIDWKKSAVEIERKVRAFNPWPSAYTTLNGKMIKIIEAEVQEQTEAGPFGEPGKTYLGTNHSVAVQTGEGFLLVKKLQIQGEKPTSAEEFIRKNIDVIGDVLDFNSI
jgi:methionyl-tRNA formyltransferase